MKTGKKTLLVIPAIALALTALARPAIAGSPWTPFSGTETLYAPTDMGRVQVVDGKMIISGMVQPAVDQTDDPRTSGQVTIVVSAEFSLPDQLGPMHGTFHLVNAEGEWTGTWAGLHTMEGGDLISDISGIGRGSGAYEGLIGKWNWRGVNASQENPYMTISGAILETGR